MLHNLQVIESQHEGQKYNYYFDFLFAEGESLLIVWEDGEGWSVFPTGSKEVQILLIFVLIYSFSLCV